MPRIQNPELTPEDSLRLNVLLTQAEAIRIDENNMVVHGLMGKREMSVQLNPNGRSDRYISTVKQLMATVVLESPEGYPVFMRRWTRMGQNRSKHLDRLLRLGESEAVVSVVSSPGLTTELARRAWWCDSSSANARRLLQHPAVVEGSIGPELASFLIEHLAFESDNLAIMDTVRLVLQPGLINQKLLNKLWYRGKSKVSYRLGFLEQMPDSLPEQRPDSSELESIEPLIAPLLEQNNSYALLFYKLLQGRGQTFLQAVYDAMRRPPDQDAVTSLFNVTGSYCCSVRTPTMVFSTVEAIESHVEQIFSKENSALQPLLSLLPEQKDKITAMIFLAHLDESIVLPIFVISDAIGSLMRKKIKVQMEALMQRLTTLLHD